MTINPPFEQLCNSSYLLSDRAKLHFHIVRISHKGATMKFASTRIEAEWNDPRLSRKVKEIVTEAAEYARQNWQWEFTITSIFRTPQEDAALHASGIHVDWRAVDVRTRGRSQQAIMDVTNHLNNRWVYDPTRPNLKVCFSEPHGSGPHAHYQVHLRSKRRS
jgi:hypothetical protein